MGFTAVGHADQEFVLFLQTGGEFKELGVQRRVLFPVGLFRSVFCPLRGFCYYFGGGVIIGHLKLSMTGLDFTRGGLPFSFRSP